MKEILKLLNEAKWYILIVFFITIIITVTITIILNNHQKVEEPKESEENVINIKLVDPPVTFLIKIPDNINMKESYNPEILDIKQIKRIFKFEDFHNKIDFYFDQNYLKYKIELFFENY